MPPRLLRRRVLGSALALPFLSGRPAGAVGSGPLTILVCGDSLAQGLFLSTQPPLRRRPALRLVNGTRHATGLTRSDDWDWVAVVREQVARGAPDVMLAWIGANDYRAFVDRAAGRRYLFGTPEFAEAYGRRVAEITGIAAASGATVAWIGLPNMRERERADAARLLNAIQQDAATAAGAQWVPCWQATSDEAGEYLPSLTGPGERRLRADDGVHFSLLGYRSIARLAFTAVAAQHPAFAPPLQGASDALDG